MSLVNSEHLTPARGKRDAHYFLKNMKESMTIWNREPAEKNCEKCHRGAYPYEKVCPRCGNDLDDGMTNEC